MASPITTVAYLCVVKSNRVLYHYTTGDQEIDKMAAACIENIPLYHKWYFESFSRRKFGFLLENSFLYFTIVDIRLPNSSVLQFLGQFKDEHTRLSKKTSKGSFYLQEQLHPFLAESINSLSQSVECAPDTPSCSVSPMGSACSTEASSSSNVPLLKEGELQEERAEGGSVQASGGSIGSPQKEFGLMRSRSGSQMKRRRWWRQVGIVLTIDAVVCLVLLGVWLGICRGLQCVH